MTANIDKSRNIRIVLLVSDLSRIGGVQTRTKIILKESDKGSVEYIAISRRHERKFSMKNAFSLEDDRNKILQMFEQWTPKDTVFLIGNSIQIEYPLEIRKLIYKFPIISLSSGQMAFMVQDTDLLTRPEFLRTNMASCILSFSNGDIAFQRQLGLHGQKKIAPLIATREVNNYDTENNKYFGYVGRIDFHAKDCERLIDIAVEFKKAGFPPLHIFTTNGGNSPDYKKLIELANRNSILDQFEIVLNCEDKSRIFSKMRMLILPSKKEASGNAILEAFSFGVPVLATSYAPGPAEIILNKSCGLLLDDFSGQNVVAELKNLSNKSYRFMSLNAFNRHKIFSIKSHLDSLEDIAIEVIQAFDGFNKLPVLPRLLPIEILLRKMSKTI